MLNHFFCRFPVKKMMVMVSMSLMLSACTWQSRVAYCPVALAIQTSANAKGQSNYYFVQHVPKRVVMLNQSYRFSPLTDTWHYREWVIATHPHPGSYQPINSKGGNNYALFD